MKSTLFWLDTETTGLNPLKDSIIELYAVIEEDCINHEMNLYSYPSNDSAIDINALEVNGKRIDEIQKYPPAEDAVQYLISKLNLYSTNQQLIIAGWNVFFDYQFLREMFSREFCLPDFDRIFSYHVLDVASISLMFIQKGWIKNIGELSLLDFSKYFGIMHNPHDAKSDCIAAMRIYRLLSSAARHMN